MTYWLVESSLPFFSWLRHSWLILLSMNLQTPPLAFASTCQHLQRPLFQLPSPEKLSRRPWTLGITFLFWRQLPSPWHMSLLHLSLLLFLQILLSSLFQLAWSGWNRKPLSFLNYKHNWGNDSTYSMELLYGLTEWGNWKTSDTVLGKFLKDLAILFSFLYRFWQGIFALSFWHSRKRGTLVVRGPGFSVSATYCLWETGGNYY